MKKYLYLLLAIAFMACNNDEPSSGGDWKWTNSYLEPIAKIQMTAGEADANEHINEFSFKLMQTISQNYEKVFRTDDKENMTVSPLSAALCLAMVANTCDDETNKSIYNALGYDDVATLNDVCNKLLRYLPAEENKVRLHLANSVWYENNYSVSDSYVELMNSVFGATVDDFDYNNQQKSLNKINGWCSDNTNGMIPKILGEIKPELKMLLLNALYFNGEWMNKFDKSLTADALFHGTLGESNVKMMKTNMETTYIVGDGYKGISIPFKDRVYYLHVILPTEGEDIVEVHNELSYDIWKSFSRKMVDATIKMPRFMINQSLNLNTPLSILGVNMNNLYLDKTGIPGKMYMNAFQKTVTSVDEDGAKVATITGAGMIEAAGPPQKYEKIEITFDRPFIFLIENSQTGSILMSGRICNL